MRSPVSMTRRLYFSLWKLLLLKMVYTVGFCLEIGGLSSTWIWGIVCCLDPKAILFVFSIWKSFSQSPFSISSSLYPLQATLQWFCQWKGMFPTNRQVDIYKQQKANHTSFIESNNSLDTALSLSICGQGKCHDFFPPRISDLFLLLTSQRDKVLRSLSWLELFCVPALKIIQLKGNIPYVHNTMIYPRDLNSLSKCKIYNLKDKW